jgi:hypothetical protein
MSPFLAKAIVGAICVVIIAAVFAASVAVLSFGCTVRWPSELKPEYRAFVGCTVEVDGLRIPDTNYRVM